MTQRTLENILISRILTQICVMMGQAQGCVGLDDPMRKELEEISDLCKELLRKSEQSGE